MITVNNVGLRYGDRKLFEDVNISSSWINLGDSIGCLSFISMTGPTFLKNYVIVI